MDLKDTLPTGLIVDTSSFILVSPDGKETSLPSSIYNAANKTIKSGPYRLYADESYKIKFKATVDAVSAGTTLTNTLDVGNGTDNASDNVAIKIERPGSDAYLKKAVDNETRQSGTVVGDTLKYTIEAGNKKAGSLWQNVSEKDALPKGLSAPTNIILTKVDGTTINLKAEDVYDPASRTIRVDIGDIAGGEKATVSFEATVTPEAVGQSLVNVAEAAGNNPDSNSTAGSEVTATAYGSVNGSGGNEPIKPTNPEAYLNKTVDNETRQSGTVVGDTLKYTIEAGNKKAGSLWQNVSEKDVLPKGLSAPTNIILTKADGTTTNLKAEDVYDPASRTIRVDIGDIAGGEKATVSFEATVTPEAVGQSLVNVAEATGNNPDPNSTAGSEATATAYGSVNGSGGNEPIKPTNPEAYLNKTVDNETRQSGTVVGDTLKYTIEAGNKKAGSLWQNVSEKDVLPKGLSAPTNIILTKADGTTTNLKAEDVYDPASRTIRVDIGDIAGGEKATVSFEATVTPEAVGQSLVNVAEATGNNPDPNSTAGSEATATAYGSVNGSGGNEPIKPTNPEAYLNKTVDNETRQSGTVVGDTLKYTIEAGNKKAGSLWQNVSEKDVLPKGLSAPTNIILTKADGTTTNLKAEDVYDPASRTIRVDIGDIAGGEKATVSFEATVTPEAVGQSLVNVAEATGNNPDPNSTAGSEATATAYGSVNGSGGNEPIKPTNPEAYLNKTVDNETRQSGTVVGDTLKYTIEAGNKKAGSLWQNVSEKDVLPKGLSAPTNIILTKADGTTTNLKAEDVYDPASRTIRVDIGDIAGGEKATVSFEATVTPEAVGQSLVNVAEATGNNPDPNSTAGSEANVTAKGSANGLIVPTIPDVYEHKTVDNLTRQDGKTAIGDTLKYTIEAGNKEPGSLWSDVTISDKLPVGLSTPSKIVLTKVDGTKAILKASDVYDTSTQKLKVNVGNIAGGEKVALTFEAKITKDAIGKSLVNIADASGMNPDHTSQDISTSGSVTPPEKQATPKPQPAHVLPHTGDTDLPWLVITSLVSTGLYLVRRRKKKIA